MDNDASLCQPGEFAELYKRIVETANRPRGVLDDYSFGRLFLSDPSLRVRKIAFRHDTCPMCGGVVPSTPVQTIFLHSKTDCNGSPDDLGQCQSFEETAFTIDRLIERIMGDVGAIQEALRQSPSGERVLQSIQLDNSLACSLVIEKIGEEQQWTTSLGYRWR